MPYCSGNTVDTNTSLETLGSSSTLGSLGTHSAVHSWQANLAGAASITCTNRIQNRQSDIGQCCAYPGLPWAG